jgi:hypothetical protein
MNQKIITPARNYSRLNRRRYTRQKRTACILAAIAGGIAAACYFIA